MRTCIKANFLVFWGIFACACTHKVMDASLVSMTRKEMPGKRKMKNAGSVHGKYCVGDPAQNKENDTIGMMDEAILNAQRKFKVDYISHATFTQKTTLFENCMSVSGDGWR